MDHKELAEEILEGYFAIPNTKESLALALVHVLIGLCDRLDACVVVTVPQE